MRPRAAHSPYLGHMVPGREALLAAGGGIGQEWWSLVEDVADFPREGVIFKDITPLLANSTAFQAVVEGLAAPFEGRGAQSVMGIEARGFIAAAPVALSLGAGFVPARKAGKLPGRVVSQDYELEYGAGALEVREGALRSGSSVLIVDDVLATGGTAAAAIELAERAGAHVAGLAFILELEKLGGRRKLEGYEIVSLRVCD